MDIYDSLRPGFAKRYIEVTHDKKVSFPRSGNGAGCLKSEDDKRSAFDCNVTVDFGSRQTWSYAVEVVADRCWKARLLQPYGPYQDSADDPTASFRHRRRAWHGTSVRRP